MKGNVVLKKVATCFIFASLCFVFAGCSEKLESDLADKTVEELNQTSSKEELKNRLLVVAETGESGSSLAGMRESIEELKRTDPNIPDELLTLCEQLESASSASKVKSIAKKMAGML